MRVVITGASGHVGNALARELIAAGHDVTALVRSDVRPVTGLSLRIVKVDVTDRDALIAACEGAELVFHAAARISLESDVDAQAEAVNVEGTRNVIAACRAHGVGRLVHFSTAHALDDGGLRGAGEGLVYERSKVAAERDVLSAIDAGLDAVIVSPCAVIGPHDFKPSHIGKVLLMLARGLLVATVDGGQSWVDVRDVARTAIAAAERGRRGARYIASGHWRSMPAMFSLAAKAAGVAPPRFAFPSSWARRSAPLAERAAAALKAEPLITRASMAALLDVEPRYDLSARTELGVEPRPLERTLADTFEFFADTRMLPREHPIARTLRRFL